MWLAALTVALFGLGSAQAVPIVLDFEGLDDLEPVQQFYNGGTGGFGSGPGTNHGVAMSPNALAIIDADDGGSGNFGGEPSPVTILFFLEGAAATMDVAAGFTTGFSFFYSAINQPGSVTVWDAPGGATGGGNLLASIPLPLTTFNGAPDPTGQFSPLVPVGVAFAGTAFSVDFGGTVNQIGFDNITFGSATPGGVVPEPATVISLATGGILCLLGARKRRKAEALTV
jgi:hypothetical protein